jgi:predicted lipid-binding transport protein (Tim44 family)
MGGGLAFIDILIFAMIAAFLVYRLRSVLGRRHGEERQRPNPYAPPPPQAQQRPTAPDNVIQIPQRQPQADAEPSPGEPVSLAQGLAQIRAADPSFDEKGFVQGARGAFEMIVEAFARSDKDTLRPLLAPDVFANFEGAIDARAQAGETSETKVLGFDEVDLTAARMQGSEARVTIRFQTRQTSVVRNAAGAVVDGDPDEALEVVDLWTFARDTRSRDPNWLLVETAVPS